MACYLPDHLVRCSICKHFFSDARRLRCGCVYCYQCCLTLVDDYTLRCRCSVEHRFKSSDDLVKVNRNHTRGLSYQREELDSDANQTMFINGTLVEADRPCRGILPDKEKRSSWCSAMRMRTRKTKSIIFVVGFAHWYSGQWSRSSTYETRSNKIQQISERSINPGHWPRSVSRIRCRRSFESFSPSRAQNSGCRPTTV